MVSENIVWAFFSPSHYQSMADDAAFQREPPPNDTYCQDVSGKWLKITAVFDCIEIANRNYRYNDVKYLGGVLRNTITKVPRGSLFPPPPKPVNEPELKLAFPAFDYLKKKKRLSKKGIPGTLFLKNGKFETTDANKMMKFFEDRDGGYLYEISHNTYGIPFEEDI